MKCNGPYKSRIPPLASQQSTGHSGYLFQRDMFVGEGRRMVNKSVIRQNSKYSDSKTIRQHLLHFNPHCTGFNTLHLYWCPPIRNSAESLPAYVLAVAQTLTQVCCCLPLIAPSSAVSPAAKINLCPATRPNMGKYHTAPPALFMVVLFPEPAWIQKPRIIKSLSRAACFSPNVTQAVL